MKKLRGFFNSLIKNFQERSQKREADASLDKFMNNVDETIKEINAEKILLNIDRYGLNFENVEDEAIQTKLIAEKTSLDRLIGEYGRIMVLKEKAKEAYSDHVPGDLAAFNDKLRSLGYDMIKRKIKANASLFAINRLLASTE